MALTLGITTNPFGEKPKEYIAERCAAFGIRVLQIAVTESERDWANTIRYFNTHGPVPVMLQKTTNFLLPDGGLNQQNLDVFLKSMELGLLLDIPAMSICGSSANTNLWAYSPTTHTEAAWNSFCRAIEQILTIAEQRDIVVALEPYVNSPLENTSAIRRILERFDSPKLKFIVDPCNIHRPHEMQDARRLDEAVEEYFAVTMSRAFTVHLKDAVPSADPHCPALPPAGKGVINYNLFSSLLSAHSYSGTAIIEHLSEDEIPETIEYVSKFMAFAAPG